MSGGVDSSVAASLLTKEVRLSNVGVNWQLKMSRIMICLLFTCGTGTREMNRVRTRGVNGRKTGTTSSSFARSLTFPVNL
jgi:hypothetical protein